MSKSIKFILLIAFLTLGISNAGSTRKDSLQIGSDQPATVICQLTESVHASFNKENPGVCSLNLPFYDEFGENSAFDISNAILLQSNPSNGLGTPKVLKNNSTIRCSKFIESGIAQDNFLRDGPYNSAANPSYRYYVYGLRHILI